MRERLQRFMQGRYGVDQLSNFIVVVAVVLLVIELFLPSFKIRSIVNLVAVCMLVYSYFRIFSRNHYKRYAENERFLKYFVRIQRWFTKKEDLHKGRRTVSLNVHAANNPFVCRKGKERLQSLVQSARQNLYADHRNA